MTAKKKRCVRCESLDRKQKSKAVTEINEVYICDFCLQEIAEEEEFFNKGANESGGKIFNNEFIEGDEFED